MKKQNIKLNYILITEKINYLLQKKCFNQLKVTFEDQQIEKVLNKRKLNRNNLELMKKCFQILKAEFVSFKKNDYKLSKFLSKNQLSIQSEYFTAWKTITKESLQNQKFLRKYNSKLLKKCFFVLNEQKNQAVLRNQVFDTIFRNYIAKLLNNGYNNWKFVYKYEIIGKQLEIQYEERVKEKVLRNLMWNSWCEKQISKIREIHENLIKRKTLQKMQKLFFLVQKISRPVQILDQILKRSLLKQSLIKLQNNNFQRDLILKPFQQWKQYTESKIDRNHYYNEKFQIVNGTKNYNIKCIAFYQWNQTFNNYKQSYLFYYQKLITKAFLALIHNLQVKQLETLLLQQQSSKLQAKYLRIWLQQYISIKSIGIEDLV